MVWATKSYSETFMGRDDTMFHGIPMIADNNRGSDYNLSKEYFRPATPEDIERQLAKVAAVKERIKEFPVGLAVSFQEHKKIETGFLFFSSTMNIWKNTEAVVDENPYVNKDNQGNESKKSSDSSNENLIINKVPVGRFMLSDLVPPMLSIYLPEHKTEIAVVPTEIEPKVFNKNIINQLILQEGVKDKVKTVISRVLDHESHLAIYETLGLSNLCQKGRGSIVLLYGVPGSGKTMTAEAFSEHYERPLIRIEANDMGNPSTIRDNLVEAFRRAKKYNAMLLIDEVDVFIRKRGVHPVLDEMTSVFLRTLEYFDGIIFMTTNLVGNIDPAIFSRIHLCVGIEEFDDNHRRQIWKGMMPPALMEAITGNEFEKEKLLDEISKIKLNGREIKTVIQNCVTQAVQTRRGNIGKTRWIPRSYFLEEAQNLSEQRQALKREYTS